MWLLEGQLPSEALHSFCGRCPGQCAGISDLCRVFVCVCSAYLCLRAAYSLPVPRIWRWEQAHTNTHTRAKHHTSFQPNLVLCVCVRPLTSTTSKLPSTSTRTTLRNPSWLSMKGWSRFRRYVYCGKCTQSSVTHRSSPVIFPNPDWAIRMRGLACLHACMQMPTGGLAIDPEANAPQLACARRGRPKKHPRIKSASEAGVKRKKAKIAKQVRRRSRRQAGN